ncbi:hypothetical protein SynRS9915_00513 [Synechococcus sp. RS9915]|nr:hypothetical protein SynRS9915_00513 [Synechococcus sp. RS9915]
MDIHLFGATTSSGQSFVTQVSNSTLNWHVYAYSRGCQSGFDFTNPSSFVPLGDSARPSIWINFAPIWLFAPFVDHLVTASSSGLSGLKGLISCSSSSVISKRFAFNRFDRDLASSLCGAEDRLLSACQRHDLPCKILRPAMIYGKVGEIKDRNLSLLLRQLRNFPVLLLPDESGLRQPIHASQLASVVLHLAQQLVMTGWDSSQADRISIGGDLIITYSEMISAIQMAQPPRDAARNCHLVHIPNRFFFLLAAPLLLFSPKAFESVLRMGANLCGFTPAYELLGIEPQPFPLLPLD